MIAADATTASVDLTVITVARGKGHATKRLISDANGLPVSDPARALWIAGGQVQRVQVPGLSGLERLLTAIRPNQVIVHGVAHGAAPGQVLTLLTAEAYTGQPGTVARTLECFAYPQPRCLIMLDHDIDPLATVQVTSVQELMAPLIALWPAFADVGYLRTISTRSAIRPKGQPDVWLRPPHGMHVYLVVTGDVARFRELLKVKLWCAGLGFCKLATPNKNTAVAA